MSPIPPSPVILLEKPGATTGCSSSCGTNKGDGVSKITGPTN